VTSKFITRDTTSMRRPSLAPVAVVLSVLALLFAGYMGAYYGLVKRTVTMTGGGWSFDVVNGKVINLTHAAPDFTAVATYGFGGEIASRAFWPAHQVDRRIRPDYWR
jgi:hypothetical protein